MVVVVVASLGGAYLLGWTLGTPHPRRDPVALTGTAAATSRPDAALPPDSGGVPDPAPPDADMTISAPREESGTYDSYVENVLAWEWPSSYPAEALKAAGVPFEVVPGITAALAVGVTFTVLPSLMLRFPEASRLNWGDEETVKFGYEPLTVTLLPCG